MNLAQIDLNLLVALEAILTEKHLTRAGDRLGLSQPTMSHTLARLRRMFDDDLLTRAGREYYLTPLAEDLVEPLRDILKSIELTIERRPAFDPARDERTFVVAASDYATYLVLQPAIELIQALAPRVSVQIQPLSRKSNESVTTGDIDLVIQPTALGTDMLPHEVLFKDRWVAVVWSGHPDVEESLSLEEYLRLPHVFYDPSLGPGGPGARGIGGLADHALYSEHPEARVAVTVHSFFLMPLLISRTRMVALTNERLARRMANLADIKILELLFDTPTTEEAIYWHPRVSSDPGHRWFRDILKKSTAALAEGT